MNKKIDNLFYILYSLLFLITPLIMFDKTSELFEFNKMLFIYFITILVVAVWIFKSLLYKKIFFQKTYFDIPIFFFLIFQIASTYFSIDQHTSIFGYYGRFNGGLLSTITYILLYYGFVSNIRFNQSKIEKLLKINIFSSLIVALWALPDKFGYDLTCYLFTKSIKLDCWTDQFRPAERAFSTLGQPNWLGAYLAVNFFIAIYFLVKSWKGKYVKFLWIGYILLNSYVMYFTKSRTSWLSILVSLILLAIIYIFIRIKNIKNKLSFIFISMILPLFIFTLFFFNSLKSLTVTNQNVTDSYEIRKIVWNGAVELAKKYPLFGTGVETFAYAYSFTRPAIHNLTSEWDYVYNKAHNEYINYLATTGILGLLSYLFFIFAFFFYVFKKIYEDKNVLFNSLLLAGFMTILVNNFSGFSITVINILFYLLLASVVIVNEKQEVESLPKPEFKKGLVFILPIIILVLGVNYVSGYLQADIYYAMSDASIRQSSYSEAAKELNKALSFRTEHVYQDKLSHVYASLALTEASTASVSAINDLFQKSVSLNRESLLASPMNIAYWKTRAKNYYYFYQLNSDEELFNTATQSLKMASDIAPTDPKIPQTTALFYSLRADNETDLVKKRNMIEESIRLLDISLKLKPNFDEAILLKEELVKKLGEL